jgi:GNAT superfamily N-acetyltransferase
LRRSFRIADEIQFIRIPMPDSQLLANPIWNALITEHTKFAVGDNLARTYQSEIGPLSGMATESYEAYECLRPLARRSGTLGLFLSQPYEARPGWKLLRGEPLNQMIFAGNEFPKPNAIPTPVDLRPLTAADIPAMVELAKLTEPGPFRKRTSELGAFFGIFESGRLLAMAGQRIRLPGFIEVSAVCTHPNARGRGFARMLMSVVMDDIFKRRATPFLHVLPSNAAIRIYESLGFIQRRVLHLAVIKNEQ